MLKNYLGIPRRHLDILRTYTYSELLGPTGHIQSLPWTYFKWKCAGDISWCPRWFEDCQWDPWAIFNLQAPFKATTSPTWLTIDGIQGGWTMFNETLVQSSGHYGWCPGWSEDVAWDPCAIFNLQTHVALILRRWYCVDMDSSLRWSCLVKWSRISHTVRLSRVVSRFCMRPLCNPQ
jgi:hypothetical protein